MIAVLLAAVLTVVDGAASSSCDRPAPEPLGFSSRGFGYVAEIFPAKSRQNHGSRSVAYLYAVGYPGSDWRVQARRVWTAELAAQRFPMAALVSQAGHLVTLDDHYEYGGGNALVIYDRDGRFVRSLTLDALLEPRDLAGVQLSDCGRAWRTGVRFFFTTTGNAKLYLLLPSRRAIELALKTGALRRGALDDFPTLSAIVTRQFPNEETEVWMTSLRFSSISDLLSKN